MAFDVVMPQMGESIAEATVLKWHKQVGDVIAKDDTLYEISTDKVDAEIPAPSNPFLSWFSLGREANGMPALRCSIAPTRMAAAVAGVVWSTPREQVCRMAQQTLEYFGGTLEIADPGPRGGGLETTFRITLP